MRLLEDCPYWVVYGDEDGGHIDGPFDTAEIKKKLEPSEDNEGHNYYGRHRFLSSFPDGGFDYWPEDALLIIQGTPIVPKAKKVATKLEF